MDGTQNVIKSNFHNLLCKLMKSLGQVYPESSELLGATVFLTSLEAGEERDDIMRQFYDAVKKGRVLYLLILAYELIGKSFYCSNFLHSN